MQGNYGLIRKCEDIPIEYPTQHQPGQPGIEAIMIPKPVSEKYGQTGSGKLRGKVAIITGGDSGIGRAIAYLFAKEGADIAIIYLNEHGDAMETKERILQLGQRCLTISGDIGYEPFCREAVARTLAEFGRIDSLINNAGVQFFHYHIEQVTAENLERTFRTNVFSFFYMAKAVVPHLKPGSTIINTSSVAADEGYPGIIDYSSSKGAVNALTRSLAASLVARGIRVNAVAPGRTWTPLIPATLPPSQYNAYGYSTPMKRSAQPAEIAPAYLFLASDDSSYVVGQTLHVNGGEYYGL